MNDYGDKTCTSMHTRASSIRSNCANTSVRTQYPMNIYTNYTASAPAVSNNLLRKDTITGNRCNGRTNFGDVWCKSERNYNETNNGVNGERFLVYHKVNSCEPQERGQVYKQFQTTLLDNNNKYLCSYDDEDSFDRL